MRVRDESESRHVRYVQDTFSPGAAHLQYGVYFLSESMILPQLAFYLNLH